MAGDTAAGSKNLISLFTSRALKSHSNWQKNNKNSQLNYHIENSHIILFMQNGFSHSILQSSFPAANILIKYLYYYGVHWELDLELL